MFEYFPGNYVWNLTVVAALNSGGLIDEVDRACRPLREIATQGSDPGTGEFLRAWTVVVDDLEAQAVADEKAGHARTAGQKYRRATNYLLHAERMQRGHAPERMAVYQRCLDLLAKSVALADPATTRVEVPYEDTSLPAYLGDASSGGSGSGGGGGRTVPCVILWNGLDSSKEHMYLSGFAEELAARGISTLMVDCPGSGQALLGARAVGLGQGGPGHLHRVRRRDLPGRCCRADHGPVPDHPRRERQADPAGLRASVV